MVDGNDIMAIGYPRGPIVGLALAAAREGTEGDDGSQTTCREACASVLAALAAVRDDPRSYAEDTVYGPVAREWLRLAAAEEGVRASSEAEVLCDEPLPYAVWGEDMIEDSAREQMDASMRLPVALAGALMADGHWGYGLPIGGVLAAEDVVIPWAIGVDISCSMRLTVFDAFPRALSGEDSRPALADALLRNTNFGAGGSFKPGRRGAEHAVLDDAEWRVTPFLASLKDTAHAQLGTSGSGNHFVEWGVFEALEEVALGGGGSLPAGSKRLALLSHSGSRGPGKKIADRYSKIAAEKHPALARESSDASKLGWLELESEAGAEYWLAMNLAARFASANHEVIHEKLACALPAALARDSSTASGSGEVLHSLANSHNLAWRETVSTADGTEREAIVHRKGATPAGPGVMGIIPGSMADAGYIVRGRGEAYSLASASHGAGRVMGRKAAYRELSEDAWRSGMAEAGVTLIGGGLDEAPAVYKSVESVLAAQRDLVDLVGCFTPSVVRMDEGNSTGGQRGKRKNRGGRR